MHLIGYGLRIDPSTGVHDDLTATVLVLGDGTRRMAIAACDVVGFGDADADAIRRDIGEAIGEQPSRVLLATSHTHAGPITGAGFKAFVALDPALDAQEAAYVRVLRDRIVGAAREAVAGLVEGRLAAGTGQAAIAINRRERLPDGQVVIGHNPDGPVDHAVGVARFDDLDGRPLACLVNYACHATVMGPQNLAVSADYPGVARRVVEQNTGARCLFLAGAGANVAALRSICAEFEPMERQGAILGLEAARVFHTLETRPIRRTRVVRQSFSLQMIWEDHVVEGPTLSRFDARVRRVSLPLRALPALPAAEAELATREAVLRDLDAEHVTGVPRMLAERQRRWAAREVDDIRAAGSAARAHGAPGSPRQRAGNRGHSRGAVRRDRTCHQGPRKHRAHVPCGVCKRVPHVSPVARCLRGGRLRGGRDLEGAPVGGTRPGGRRPRGGGVP
jgi:hypothetical protein